MKILITEQRPGAATEVAQRLGAAGHTLTYCHSPDPDDAPCVALGATGRCPLTDLDVAVVVDTRVDRAAITDTEFGAVCALRHGTPLVVAGPVPDENRPRGATPTSGANRRMWSPGGRRRETDFRGVARRRDWAVGEAVDGQYGVRP